MSELFQRNKSTISRHIKNLFEEGELNKDVVVAFLQLPPNMAPLTGTAKLTKWFTIILI